LKMTFKTSKRLLKKEIGSLKRTNVVRFEAGRPGTCGS